MENIDIYTSIIDAKEIINVILKICYVCLGINAIFWLIRKNKANEKQEEKSKFEIIELIGYILIAVISVFFIILFLTKTNIMTFLAFPSYILCFYIVYIKPMMRNNDNNFDYDYASYGSLLVVPLTVLLKFDFKESFLAISSETSLQIICISILLFEIYTAFYCLLLNVYFVIKSLGNIGLEKFYNLYKSILKKINLFIGFSEINIEFSTSKNAIKNDNLIKKILKFILCFIYDLLKGCFILIVSLIFSFIISPFLFVIRSFISILLNISKTNENQFIYGITKIVAVVSIILIYVLLQANIIFKDNIIAIYEFISTAILIPIILDGLNYFKEKINMNELSKKD